MFDKFFRLARVSNLSQIFNKLHVYIKYIDSRRTYKRKSIPQFTLITAVISTHLNKLFATLLIISVDN